MAYCAVCRQCSCALRHRSSVLTSKPSAGASTRQFVHFPALRRQSCSSAGALVSGLQPSCGVSTSSSQALHRDKGSRGSIASGLHEPTHGWRQAASQHRSAGFSASAVRLRRQGGQQQKQQPNGSGEPPPSSQKSSAAAQPSDRTPIDNAAVNGAADQRQPNGHPAAQAARGQRLQGRQSPQILPADRQPPRASSGIQATDWLTDNAPWVSDQTLPNDGATWPSNVSSVTKLVLGSLFPKVFFTLDIPQNQVLWNRNCCKAVGVLWR